MLQKDNFTFLFTVFNMGIYGEILQMNKAKLSIVGSFSYN